jgi:Ca-activated chloride channel homolog
VTFPDEEPKNEVLGSLWARAKVEDLMNQDLGGIQRGTPNPAQKEEILGLGLRFQLMTQFTSFVAVEEKRITEGGQAKTVSVPVEMPEGVSYEGVFGGKDGAGRFPAAPGPAVVGRYAGGNLALKSAAPGAKGKGGGGGMGGFGAPSADGPARVAPPAEALRERKADDSVRAEAPRAALDANSKLAPELRGLAKKIAAMPKGATMTIGKAQIQAGRVKIRVQVTALSDEVVAKLKAAGLVVQTQVKADTVVVGTIDVAKLDALAELDVVKHIEPAP